MFDTTHHKAIIFAWINLSPYTTALVLASNTSKTKAKKNVNKLLGYRSTSFEAQVVFFFFFSQMVILSINPYENQGMAYSADPND